MDDLPPPLVLEILSRLRDSGDVARCRISSKTLNTLASEIRSVDLQCSYLRYAKSRSPLTRSSITPFKSIFHKLISQLRIVERVSIGVGKPLGLVAYDDVEDEEDDLFLSDVNFVKAWLPNVCGDLASVSISDFWVQSCWRRSDVLSVFSAHCLKLHELEIKNAWLSVDGLTPLKTLTSLTLEFIRLDDENLEKVSECFPCLRILKLIGVGGLKEPKIDLMHLETCHWSLSNAPISISIIAPNLISLNLKCVKPNMLMIEAPFLSKFYLTFEGTCNFKVKEFSHLEHLYIESTNLRNVLVSLPLFKSVKNLIVDSPRWEVPVGVSKSIFELLLRAFPNVNALTLNSGAWSEFEACPVVEGSTQIKGLKEIRLYLSVDDVEATLSAIFTLLDHCSDLSTMSMFIHRDVVSNVTSTVISQCTARCPRLRWKWGMWKQKMMDSWMSDPM
ncbi:F-box/LRR-repeat protein At4g29420 [Andrographis paniculata]|uniref:F-box/LRR-repeat protein At4g29420 n=1 Tax=Andrographis paniculata TaxID=175694 RepID=UPI0021E97337|nr:F-box/LRR-repeat protein At4g29420 [Andrographis paniculata]